MPGNGPHERGASGAPFLFLGLVVGAVLASGTPAAHGETPALLCPPDRIDQTVEVSQIFDGDTVRLADGRKVRLIGINAPEIGHDGAPSEAYAEQAREDLSRLVHGHRNVGLRFDAERHDKYGRLLAHLFLPDGRSIEARLLEQGVATSLAIPPNTWNLDCYLGVEAKARSKGTGLWGLSRYQPVEATHLPLTSRGYHLVRGKVERIGHGRKSIWLDLQGPVALRIPRADLKYFHTYDPRTLRGRTVVARGWLHRNKGELRMTVRHPADLDIAGN